MLCLVSLNISLVPVFVVDSKSVVSYREHFGHKHPKYSDTLLDYGFYLLNVDNICQSVAIYQVSRLTGNITVMDIVIFMKKHMKIYVYLTERAFSLYKCQTALDIRQSVFGGKNIHVATAHEDLAYSSYVHQYSSGKFDNAL